MMMDVTKSNYAPRLPAPIYFRRSADGAMCHVDLGAERKEEIAQKLVQMLGESEKEFSRNELVYREGSKDIREKLKHEITNFNRIKDRNDAIDYALISGWLREKTAHAKKGKAKIVLEVTELGKY